MFIYYNYFFFLFSCHLNTNGDFTFELRDRSYELKLYESDLEEL